MHNPQATHPDRAALEAYGLGLQAPRLAEVIERHLAGCEPCGQVLESVRDDWLVAVLRPAAVRQGGAATVSEVRTGQSASTMDGNAAPSKIPAELVDHPRYCILERLGAGGMGIVYKARHRVMDQLVALKVIHRHLLDEPKAVARFQREIKTVAGLVHPNIVRARDAEESAGVHFLVMDYVEGTTLAQVVHAEGPLSVARACAYVRQAALGLQHAFERGIVHRDLKPHNLLCVAAEGGERILILDFGLARFVRETDASLTGGGAMMGTPDYMAPEQATNAAHADTRADIYSLGCTLYFLLAGRPPFPEGSSVEKVLAHLRQRPRPLRELRVDVPAELARVVERMMAREPAQRYQTPAEVAAALTPFAIAVPVIVRPQLRRRWPLVAAAAVGGGVVALALVVAAFSGGQPDPGPKQAKAAKNAEVKKPEAPLFKGPAPIAEAKKLEAPLFKGPAPKAVVGEIRRYVGHKQGVKSLAFAPDGKAFVSGSFGEVWLWDVDRATERQRFPGFRGWAHGVAVSPDGKLVAAGGQGGLVKVWEAETGKTIHEQQSYNTAVESLAFVPNRPRWLCIADAGVQLFDLETKQAVPKRFLGTRACLSPDGRRLLSCDGKVLYLFELDTTREVSHARHREELFCLALAPDGRHAIAGGLEMTVDLWDMEAKEQLLHLQGHKGTVQAVAVSPDGRRALSGGGDNMVRLWDLQTGKEVYCFEGHTGEVVGVAFAPDGRTALSASMDKSLRLWGLPEPAAPPR